MFRASIARHARLVRLPSSLPTSAATAASSSARQARQIFAAGLIRPARPSLISQACRLYSSTAEAQRESLEDAPSSRITQFDQLERLGVDASIVKSITVDMGYKDMTDVQSATISPGLSGKDLVAQAKTGTGKTLAFLVPVLQQIISSDPSLAMRRERSTSRSGRRDFDRKPINIRALIISPTRELAEQIAKEAQKLCGNNGIQVQLAVGGTQKREALHRMHAQGCDLLVGTPGRLNDLLSDDRSGVTAPNLSCLVLDEADRMLDAGFDRELRSIVDMLPDRNRIPRQTLLFSATLPDDVVNLARWYVDNKNFEFVQTIKADEVATHDKVPQYIVPVARLENMLPSVVELILRETDASAKDPSRPPFKAIIYLPYTAMTQLVGRVFVDFAKRLNLPRVNFIHSKLTQAQRTNAAEDFRRATSGILVSSDVTARGMDFPNVSHVIQYDLPSNREQYIHRLGRTGRADKSGEGWIFVPEFGMHRARGELGGLPIKRRSDIEAATQVEPPASLDEAPLPYKVVAESLRRMPRDMLEDVYTVHFGKAQRNVLRELVEGLNDWATHAWGWEEPPVVSRGWAAKMGLDRTPGLNIGSRRSGGDEFSDAFEGGSSRGSYGRGDGGFGRGNGGYGRGDGGYGRGDGGFGRGDGGSGRGRRGYDRGDGGYGRNDRGFGRGNDRSSSF